MSTPNRSTEGIKKATVSLLIALFVAYVIYRIAASLWSLLILDDQDGLGWLDTSWFQAVILGVVCGLVVWRGLKVSARFLAQYGHAQPRRLAVFAFWSAGAFSLLVSQVLLPSLPLELSILIFIGLYGLILYEQREPVIKKQYIVAVMCIAIVLTLGYGVIAYLKPTDNIRAFVSVMWLPDSAPSSTDKLELPVQVSARWHPLYGKAIEVKSRDGEEPYAIRFPITLYQARGNAWLDPTRCPDIYNTEEIVPSDCKNIGVVHGSKVYAINRSLPGSAYEIYTQFGSTFIYVNIPMGDDETALRYLRALRAVPSDMATQELRHNQQVLSNQLHDLRTKYETLAERLPFTPVLPAGPPANWLDNYDEDITIRGTLDKPETAEVSYMDGNGHTLTIDNTKLAGFSFNATACGPLPREDSLPCYKVQGKDYYYAYNAQYNTHYYLRPVDDVVVISSITLEPDDYKTPNLISTLLQSAIDLNMQSQPQDPTKLKKVQFVDY